jgi:hypothetical protein
MTHLRATYYTYRRFPLAVTLILNAIAALGLAFIWPPLGLIYLVACLPRITWTRTTNQPTEHPTEETTRR